VFAKLVKQTFQLHGLNINVSDGCQPSHHDEAVAAGWSISDNFDAASTCADQEDSPRPITAYSISKCCCASSLRKGEERK
jgi:hypothetical protein